jgi:hypothetical protein
MPRSRLIHPGLFTDPELYEAEERTGLPLRLAYTGLSCVADREGRFKWEPRVIKLDVLPYDPVDFAAVLDALAAEGFIRAYEVEGHKYGHIPNFLKYQKPHEREAASRIPPPPGDRGSTAGAPRANPAQTKGKPKARPRSAQGARYTVTGIRSVDEQSADERSQTPPDGGEAPDGVAPPAEKPVKGGWPARMAEIFRARIGIFPPGEFGRHLAPAVAQHGEELVLQAAERYCRDAPGQEKPQYLKPKYFAEQVGVWVERCKPIRTYDEHDNPTPELLAAMGKLR